MLINNLCRYPSENADGVEGFEDALATFYENHASPIDPKPTAPLLIPDEQNGFGSYKREIIDSAGIDISSPDESAGLISVRAPRRGLIPE